MRGDGGPRAHEMHGRAAFLQTDSRERTRVGCAGHSAASQSRVGATVDLIVSEHDVRVEAFYVIS